MRLFHAQLLDTHFSSGSPGSAGESASDAWACLLSRADTMRFTCIADGVTGTSPTLTMTLLGSAIPNSGSFNIPSINYLETTSILLNAVPLAGGFNVLSASFLAQDAGNPAPRELFLNVTFGFGSAATAHVRVWVCGRGTRLLEPVQQTSASFAAQYAAARIIEDQNRVPDRKQSLAAGASLFYPPELFLPSLKWER